MSEIAEQFEHNGKTVTLYYEEDTEFANPRDADNLGVMLANGHRNYTLGDETFQHGLDGEYEDAADALRRFAEEGKIHKFPKWLQKHLGASVVIPLGLIDHSGISMYAAPAWLTTGDASNQFDPGGWDSGLIGFIFDTAKRREVIGTPAERIEEALRQEVASYDQYLTGDVYRYQIEDADGDEEEGSGGYLGFDYAKASAMDAAGYTCKHCQQPLTRWVGAINDTAPEGDDRSLVHSCCKTCQGDVEWGGDGWRHLTAPWDWPGGKPDHVAEIAHRYKCADGEHFGDTDQEVAKYS